MNVMGTRLCDDHYDTWVFFDSEPFIVKERRRKMDEAVTDVEALEKWRPATPLVNPLKV